MLTRSARAAMRSLRRSSRVARVDSCTALHVAKWSSGVDHAGEIPPKTVASSDFRAVPRWKAVVPMDADLVRGQRNWIQPTCAVKGESSLWMNAHLARGPPDRSVSTTARHRARGLPCAECPADPLIRVPAERAQIARSTPLKIFST